MTCPEFGNARTGSGLSSLAAASLDAQLFAASRCRAELLAAGIDPAAYSTAASAADVEDLRRVLGVREWTLYGVSYGTRLALAVLRDFPGTVRAAVLDSALPPQARYDDESASNLEAAFELALRDCTASSDCRSAYPNLRVRFFDALQAADASPVVVSIPGADGPRPLGLVGADLASLISTASTSDIANAPRLLDAVARRDTSVLGPLVRGSFGPSDFAWGMRLSVWCGESLPYTARATAEGPGSALAGLESAVVPPAVCQEWSVPVRPEREVSPVDSDVPVLLIAGEYDPATPPKWAYEAFQTLSNGRVVVLRAAGHVPTQDWEGDGCAMRLASAFVSSPADFDPAKEGEGCLAARPAPEFVIEDP